MPLTINGPVPAHWVPGNDHRTASISSAGCVRIALVNNMPDSALEDTEAQFFGLLAEAAGHTPVHVSLFSLPNVPRGERGQKHLLSFYRSTDELWNEPVDAIIITGTEPRQSDLREEPYWSALAELLDWAESNTQSAILSCLAAHAGVLHSDAIARRRLGDKQFGVFDQSVVADHSLVKGVSQPVRFPHSRWNELPDQELIACGYTVLTRSAQAGVDSFLKKKKNSLFVHFQGHPEYGPQTLYKEYRRDVGRFLRNEREIYPSMPHGYFDSESTNVLAGFQKIAVARRQEELLAVFPNGPIVSSLQHSWRNAAVRIYRNWLDYVASRKAEPRHIALAAKASEGTRTYVSNTLRSPVPVQPPSTRYLPAALSPQGPVRPTASLRPRRTK